MSILEIIVLLIGTSVIAVLLYGAYQFWNDPSEDPTSYQATKKARTGKVRPALPKADWPIEAVSGRRPS